MVGLVGALILDGIALTLLGANWTTVLAASAGCGIGCSLIPFIDWAIAKVF